MKLICNQEDLARFLQITARALATKSTLPILTGILVETKGDYLHCVATDLEIALEVKVPQVQIVEPGAVVVPGKTFVEIIRRLPPVPLEIEYDEAAKQVTIAGPHFSYQLPILPFAEFPALPEQISGDTVTVNGEELKKTTQQTIYATLAEDPRPFLSSILWEFTPERLRLVATDVNRLAIKDLPLASGINRTALVPVRALRELTNIFGTATEDLQIQLSDKMIFITGNGISFSSRLVEAQFPRYEQVIPQDFSGTLISNRLELIEALERASLVSNSLKLSLSARGLIITAKEPEKGRSYEEVAGELAGPELEIGFNARFLLDFLRAVDSERVVLKYLQEQKPALLQGEGREDYRYIIMPLKLAI